MHSESLVQAAQNEVANEHDLQESTPFSVVLKYPLEQEVQVVNDPQLSQFLTQPLQAKV